MPNNFVLLERIELNATVASVTFANIPQTGYTDLKIVVASRNDASNVAGGLALGFNGLTTNLSCRFIYGYGSGFGSVTDTSNIFSYNNGASSTTSTFGNAEIYIPNYSNTSYAKSVSIDAVFENNATEGRQMLTAGLWNSTAAITSITLTTFNNSNKVTTTCA